MLVLTLPIKTVSEANTREHWAVRRGRRIVQQRELNIEWKQAMKRRRVELPCVVTLTRIAPKVLDDDNLRSAFKACRDEIARLIGVDDGSPLIRFEYGQEPTGRRAYAVRIEVEAA